MQRRIQSFKQNISIKLWTTFRFDKVATSKWLQRYLYNDKFWGVTGSVKFQLPGNCPGPILFYSGNEGPIEAFYSSNGFMQELASAWGGLDFGEHRYMENPYHSVKILCSKNALYLSTEQATADYATLLTELKTTILENAASCPVISFGGSYGGTLTTYFRLKYPQVVIGGLAASAPIGYYANNGWNTHGVDEYTWIDIVNKVYREAEAGCLDALSESVSLIRQTENQQPEEKVREHISPLYAIRSSPTLGRLFYRCYRNHSSRKLPLSYRYKPCVARKRNLPHYIVR